MDTTQTHHGRQKIEQQKHHELTDIRSVASNPSREPKPGEPQPTRLYIHPKTTNTEL